MTYGWESRSSSSIVVGPTRGEWAAASRLKAWKQPS